MHWEVPDLFWVCGGQSRAHMQEADNSWLGVAIQIKSKRQSKGNNMKIKSQQVQAGGKERWKWLCLFSQEKRACWRRQLSPWRGLV